MSRRSTKTTKARPVPPQRPTFAPYWTVAAAHQMADQHLAPHNAVNTTFRVALAILARTPEELMQSALQSAKEVDEEAPAECISRLLLEAEDALKGRLEIIQSAQARLMLCACFVHGVEIPR